MSQRFTLQAPDSVDSWTEHPEDWQFEDPLVSVSKDGEVRKKELFARPKVTPPKMRSISEILGKEADSVKFLDLPMEKQIKLVAEEYNAGTKIHKIEDKLGISKQTIYDRLDKAKAMGLVTMRGAGNAAEEPVKAPKVTPEFFREQADHKFKRAEQLREDARRLEDASGLAQGLVELLGDGAGDLISALYQRLSV